MEWLRDRGASLLQVGGNLALDLGGGGEWEIEEGNKSAAAWLQIVFGVESCCTIYWNSRLNKSLTKLTSTNTKQLKKKKATKNKSGELYAIHFK